MDANLLIQAFEELKKLKNAIEDAEKQLAAGQRDLSTAAIGNQSKILAQLFKQIAGSELPRNPQYRNDFTRFSLELKDLLQRANNLRLQRAGNAPAPSNPETASPNNVSQTSKPVETPSAPVANIVEAPLTVQITAAPPSAAKVSIPVSKPSIEPEKRSIVSESPPATQIVRPADPLPPVDLQSTSIEPKKPAKKFALKGWLRKQGDVGLKTWKRRFFKYNDGKLRYFEQEDDLKPKGWIDLSTMISCAIDDGDKFSITCTNRVWHLQAEKATDAQHWVKALQLWAQKHAVISGSGASSSSSSVSNFAEIPAAPADVPVAPAAAAVDNSVDRKRQREVEYEQMMREREVREQKRQRKLLEAQQLARREAEASRTSSSAEGDDPSSDAHKSPRITPADVEALRGAMSKLRSAQDEARQKVKELSSQLADLKQRSRPSAGLPVIMQLQAQVATRKHTIRQVWTPAVQQYHNELTSKQHQLLEIKAKSSHNATSASQDSSFQQFDSAWAELERKSHIVDIRLNDLAFERMHGHPIEEVSTKDQVRSLGDKKDMLLESLAANSVQLSILDQKEETERIEVVSKVAKVAETILTRRAQLLLARSQFQQLRMRCNMGWSGSSLLTYQEEMSMLSTEYAQILVTNVKLHLLQQTGSLPRINVEELISQLTQNPETANKFSEWPKFVANYIYSQK